MYLNSGADRVLALDRHGTVALDSGRLDGLDPGGGTFGPDGRYYVGVRQRRTILALPPRLNLGGDPLFPDGIVPFPRGFGFGRGGELYLASGIARSGEGDNTIAVFEKGGALRTPRLVDDPELSPLDLIVAPNANVVVSSEWPYGSRGARATVREYDPSSGRLVRLGKTTSSRSTSRLGRFSESSRNSPASTARRSPSLPDATAHPGAVVLGRLRLPDGLVSRRGMRRQSHAGCGSAGARLGSRSRP